MVYGVTTLRTKPGKRFAGIDQLKKLAKWITDRYGIPAQVLGNGTGAMYQNHLLTQFESVAQMDELNTSMVAQDEFSKWFEESEGLLDWEESTFQYYDVLE